MGHGKIFGGACGAEGERVGSRYSVWWRVRVRRFGLVAVGLWVAAVAVGAAQQAGQQAAKKVVTTAADLPGFSYTLTEPPSQLLVSDDATFDVLADKVKADADAVLAGYDIEDKASLRSIYSALLDVELLEGDWKAASGSIAQIAALEDKPEAKATAGLLSRAIVEGAQDAGAGTGPAFQQAFAKHFAQDVQAIPWAASGETLKGLKTSLQIVTPELILNSVKGNSDPAAAKAGEVIGFDGAVGLVDARLELREFLPLKEQILAVVMPVVAAHHEVKPDIWAARDVTLSPNQKLTPVRIAIFDSGVDTSLYPGQLFVDPKPGVHSPHGLAFDQQGALYNGDLQPLTPEQKTEYPKFLALSQGLDDLENGLDTPAAADARKLISTMPADQMQHFSDMVSFMGQYGHGTHVAGIAVKGDPAARLVVIQFDDSLPDLPFAPSVAWAEKFKADFKMVGEYLRDNNVRVVNMSWADSQGEIEQWLQKTSPTTAETNKELAAQVYAVWREAVMGAMTTAPNTLFVCAAGNSNSNASFLGDVPASLKLPNLVTVGAVDQAGDETSFTSYGPTVLLDADGFQVESFVPGGTRLKESGTSMASPNVANLAAKLFAIDPKLTPEQVLNVMEKTATPSADGRLHLIDPKAAVAMVKGLPAK